MLRTQKPRRASSVTCGTPYSGATYNLLPWSDSVPLPLSTRLVMSQYVSCVRKTFPWPLSRTVIIHHVTFPCFVLLRYLPRALKRSFVLAFPFNPHPLRLNRLSHCTCSYYYCLSLVIALLQACFVPTPVIYYGGFIGSPLAMCFLCVVYDMVPSPCCPPTTLAVPNFQASVRGSIPLQPTTRPIQHLITSSPSHAE